MKPLLFPFACLVLFVCASCKKDKEETTTTPNGTTGFTWTENGGATITADSAYYTAAYKTIMAWKGGSAKHFEINLTAGTPATYTIGSGNAVTLLTGGDMYAASAGSVVVSANAGSKMSGTFTTTGTGAGLTAVNGNFTDIPVR